MEGYDLSDFVVTGTLALIMAGIGLSLTGTDFKNIFLRPKAIITALSVQLIIVPALAFLIASISGLSEEARVGLVIISACASGATSNLITHLFRGNVALAISMTTINSLVTVVWVPFVIKIALWTFMRKTAEISLPFFETVLQIFLVILIPASFGMLIRAIRKEMALKLEKPLKYILPTLLAVVFSIKLFGGESLGGSGMTFREGIGIFPWCLLLNLLAMWAGYITARIIKLQFRNQFTVAIEVGLHNTTLAFLVAGALLHSTEMEKPAIVYAMFSFFTAVIFVYILKKYIKPGSLHRTS
jgi:bile acid:Na+ symporter, BASS family